MHATHLETFGHTLQVTHLWLKDLMEELGWDDQHKAYVALKAALHTLRDRLTIVEAAQMGAQLPMLIRGFYYEGWTPTGKPVKERHKDVFVAHIREYLKDDEGIDPEQIIRAVFQVLARRITAGEIEDIKHILPPELRTLWP